MTSWESTGLSPLLGPRSVVDAALAVDTTGDESALVEGLAALARQDSALSLRLAMILAWVQRHDAACELGMSFTAFVQERVGLGTSWLRELIRLVNSPLDLVKAAACQELIPLRVAIKAANKISPQEQETWLLEALGTKQEQAQPRVLDWLNEQEAKSVSEARRLARICLGRQVSQRQVDDYIIESWRQKLPAAKILADARKPPPPPVWEGELQINCADPAALLLGRWTEPTSLAHALNQIEELQALQRGRAAALARGWAMIGYYGSWVRAGYSSQWDFAREVLGWSKRTAQRQKALGWNLEWYPELDEAVRSWLDPGSATHIAHVVNENAARWIALAKRVGRLELRRATEDAYHDGRTLEKYNQAIDLADEWAAGRAGHSAAAGSSAQGEIKGCLSGVPAAGDDFRGRRATEADSKHRFPVLESRATEPGGPGVNVEFVCPFSTPTHVDHRLHSAESSSNNVLKVAIPHDEGQSPQTPAMMKAPPELPKAARWFLDEVKLPPQHGFSKVKQRDKFKCQNPECGRSTLRTEAHHIHWRSRGGSDDLEENGITVCRLCHLRGIHTGANGESPRITVERVVLKQATALLWSYADGRQVLAFQSLGEDKRR